MALDSHRQSELATETRLATEPRRHGEDTSKLTGEVDLTERIIGCALTVHRELGPGLLEATYEEALCIELDDNGISYERQAAIPVKYKTQVVGEYRIDLLVEGRVVVELKAVERLDPLFEAQVLTYLKAANVKVGLLVNFNSRLLKGGIKRLVR